MTTYNLITILLVFILYLFYCVHCIHALTNVEEIKCLDNNITTLMEKAITVEEVSRMQRFVTFYTGEMAGVVWQMVEPMQPAELWDVCVELHAHGKPRFIDMEFNSERYMRMFQWTLDDISYFSCLRADANTVWEQFETEYRERRHKQHHTRYFTTHPGIEEVTLP